MTKSAYSEAHQMMVEAIVAARQEAGLKQAEVAATLGKNQSYISNIERGQRRIDVLEFYMLARAIGMEPTALFRRAIKRFPKAFDV
jgi:transcriptional regulator with XRE-family HTH domain